MRHLKQLILLALLLITCALKTNDKPEQPVKNPKYVRRILRRLDDKIIRKLYNQQDLSFIKEKGDTIFIMQKLSGENLAPLGKIWNSKNSISFTYHYNGKKVTLLDPSYTPFQEHHIALVEKMDSITLRSEKDTLYSHATHITATRIIYDGHKSKYLRFRFMESDNIFRVR